MKKQKLKGLSLNKKSVSNLNQQDVKGGGITDGCSDGCTPFQTAWNCTKGADCTADCMNGNSNLCPI